MSTCLATRAVPGPAPYTHYCAFEPGHRGRHCCRTCQATWSTDVEHPVDPYEGGHDQVDGADHDTDEETS